jgi:hypothetical protein
MLTTNVEWLPIERHPKDIGWLPGNITQQVPEVVSHICNPHCFHETGLPANEQKYLATSAQSSPSLWVRKVCLRSP